MMGSPAYSNKSWFRCGLFAAVTALACSSNALTAIEPTNDSQVTGDGQASKGGSVPLSFDRKSELQARRLVANHLPQLKNILETLRESESQEYAKAVVDLARSAKKLELAKSRSERGFEVELQLLKAQTEVNLLTARLRVRDSSRDRKLLRDALTGLQAAQLKQSEYEVHMLRDRLERTEMQLGLAEQRLQSRQTISPEQFEKTFLRLIRKAGRELNDSSNSQSGRSARPTENSTDPTR